MSAIGMKTGALYVRHEGESYKSALHTASGQAAHAYIQAIRVNPDSSRKLTLFILMMEGLATGKAEPRTIMMDATYLKAHRTALSLRLKKGLQTT